MDRKTKGRLAEVKVVAYFIENSYEIYLPFSNNSKYDLIAYKDGSLKRVSVKYTSAKRISGAWAVEMRQISRRNKYIHIEKFDKARYDIVAVYIGPEDRVVIIEANQVNTRSLHIKQ